LGFTASFKVFLPFACPPAPRVPSGEDSGLILARSWSGSDPEGFSGIDSFSCFFSVGAPANQQNKVCTLFQWTLLHTVYMNQGKYSRSELIYSSFQSYKIVYLFINPGRDIYGVPANQVPS